jgi:hypothetical protein
MDRSERSDAAGPPPVKPFVPAVELCYSYLLSRLSTECCPLIASAEADGGPPEMDPTSRPFGFRRAQQPE